MNLHEKALLIRKGENMLYVDSSVKEWRMKKI